MDQVTKLEVFPEQELNQRLAAVRKMMKAQGLDALLVSDNGSFGALLGAGWTVTRAFPP